MRPCSWLAIVLAGGAAHAQDFERVEGPILLGIPKSSAAKPRDALTLAQLGGLPNVLKGARSAFLVVKTDQGNLARLLVAPAFRKGRDEGAEPVPILAIDRFDCFELPGATRRLAHGKDLSLFHGFRFDLDTGQVVPEGQGGDLLFRAEGEGGPRLSALGGVSIFTLDASPLPSGGGGGAGRPSPGRAVAPTDFHGRYRLFANGQATGTLDVNVNDGDVSGRFRSDQTGSSYPIAGQVGAPANRIRFTVTLPRTKQEYDGFLFTDGKGAIAGTTTLLDRPFGFFALREGGIVAPDGDEAEPPPRPDAAPGRFAIDLDRDGAFRIEGKPVVGDRLAESLQAAIAEEPATWVLLRVPASLPYEKVAGAIRTLRDAGAEVVRVVIEDARH